MTITRIKARYVIGFDGLDHVIVDDACVVYEDERVLYVGRQFAGRVDVDMDMGRAIVSPGFIDLDALADIDHALLDCWAGAEHAKGLDWSEDYFSSGPRHVFSPSERSIGREFALRQLILNGVTTAMPIAAEMHSAWAESFDDFTGVAQIAERLGLRMYLGPSYRAGVNVVTSSGVRDIAWDHERGRAGLADAVRYVQHVESLKSPILTGCLLPARIETMTPELLRLTAQASDDLECLVRLHCMQEDTELAFLDEWYGRTPLELLREHGLLNRRLLIPHALHLGRQPMTEEQLTQALADLARVGGVIHCPLTSVRNGKALDSVRKYRDAGVTMAIGSDSFPPDLISGMSYGTNIAKLLAGRQDAGDPAEYFRAATLGGAQALQRPDLGRLAEGCLADLIVVDLNNPRTGVVDDPIRTLLMNCSGRDVVMSVIHGRTVMVDGEVLAPGPSNLLAQAQRLFNNMKTAYSGRDYRGRSTEELFPATFRVV